MNDVPTEAGPLPPDVAALLTELAAALNRRGMYPPGHPALARAARSVAEKARPPLEARGELLLAVARDRILHGGDPSDRSHPMLRDLADPHPEGDPEQAGQAVRRGTGDHEPAPARWREAHPGERG